MVIQVLELARSKSLPSKTDADSANFSVGKQ